MSRLVVAGFLFPLLFTFPVHTQAPVLPEIKASQLKLLFTGDLMAHLEQLNGAKLKDGSYRFDSSFSKINSVLSAADLTIGNLETVIGNKKTGYFGYPQFLTPVSYLSALKSAGFDILTTANNHTFDGGPAGINRTLSALDSLEFLSTGSFSDSLKPKLLFTERNGIKLGLLAATYGINGTIPKKDAWRLNTLDTVKLGKVLTQIPEMADSLRPDFMIASLHWGNEYALAPTDEQKKLADWLFSKGIDVIVGSHPHVVQGFEKKKILVKGDSTDQTVFFSLGNFISAQRTYPRSFGAVLSLTVEKSHEDKKTKLTDFSLLPLYVHQDLSKTESRFVVWPAGYNADSLIADKSVKAKVKEARKFILSQVLKPDSIFVR